MGAGENKPQPDRSKPGERGRPLRILVLTYWSFEDALVQAYTLPYVRMIGETLPWGSTIHLVTLDPARTRPGSTATEGYIRHSFTYKPFGIKGVPMIAGLVWHLYRLIIRERIDVVHAWCTPAGMIGYLLSLFTGRPLIIDSYEPHADAMVENGTWSAGGMAFRLLFLFERLQTKRAKVVIAAAEGMRTYALARYGTVPLNFHVKPACVDLEQFSFRNLKNKELMHSLGLEGKLIAVYAGKFGGIYLGQEVFDFFRVARDHWGERFHVLLLTDHPQAELDLFITSAGLSPTMFTIRFVPHADIPDHMGLADFALTPVKPVPTKRFCTPIKDGEYWALGLPVVITPHISDDSDIIEEYGIGSVVRSFDKVAYQKSVREIDALLTKHDRSSLYAKIRPVAEQYRSFNIARRAYAAIYGAEGEAFQR